MQCWCWERCKDVFVSTAGQMEALCRTMTCKGAKVNSRTVETLEVTTWNLTGTTGRTSSLHRHRRHNARVFDRDWELALEGHRIASKHHLQYIDVDETSSDITITVLVLSRAQDDRWKDCVVDCRLPK